MARLFPKLKARLPLPCTWRNMNQMKKKPITQGRMSKKICSGGRPRGPPLTSTPFSISLATSSVSG